jgi:hypothetical protein
MAMDKHEQVIRRKKRNKTKKINATADEVIMKGEEK